MNPSVISAAADVARRLEADGMPHDQAVSVAAKAAARICPSSTGLGG